LCCVTVCCAVLLATVLCYTHTLWGMYPLYPFREWWSSTVYVTILDSMLSRRVVASGCDEVLMTHI
jgi:hypothetical protein